MKNKYVRNSLVTLCSLALLTLPTYAKSEKKKLPKPKHELILTLPYINGETMFGISYGFNFKGITIGLGYTKNFGGTAKIGGGTYWPGKEGITSASSRSSYILFERDMKKWLLKKKQNKKTRNVGTGIYINPGMNRLTLENSISGEEKIYNSYGISIGSYIKAYNLFDVKGLMCRMQLGYKFQGKMSRVEMKLFELGLVIGDYKIPYKKPDKKPDKKKPAPKKKSKK